MSGTKHVLHQPFTLKVLELFSQSYPASESLTEQLHTTQSTVVLSEIFTELKLIPLFVSLVFCFLFLSFCLSGSSNIKYWANEANIEFHHYQDLYFSSLVLVAKGKHDQVVFQMWHFTLLTTSPLILVSIKSSLILKDSLSTEKFIRGQCLLASLHSHSPPLMQLLQVLRALSPFIISRDRKHSQNIADPHLWELKQLPGISANTTELLKS